MPWPEMSAAGRLVRMTTPGPAATAPSRAVAGVAVLGALVLLGGVALSARGVATEDLGTVVSAASEGTVLVVDGAQRPARRGAAVPDGALVRTPDGGTAALSTGGRVVQLAPATALRVLDGARQRLESGSALVAATDGPGMQLTTDSGTEVDVLDDAVVRVEDAFPVRVAAYLGRASVGVDRRRARTAVPTLHQVEVQGRSLPSRPSPLRLLPGDAWERERLAMVVEADTDLRRTVTGYEEQGGVVVAALLERDPALRDEDSAVVRAEQALAFALAHEDGTDFRPERYRALMRDRVAGGSWGVVAALNDASPRDVDAYTDSLAPGEAPGTLRAAPQPAAGGDVLGPLVGLPAQEAEQSAEPAASTAPSPRPTSSSSPLPRPTASPAPGEPDPLPAPVRDVVDTVLDVLPLDPPVTVSGPTPTPTPLLDVELDVPLLR